MGITQTHELTVEIATELAAGHVARPRRTDERHRRTQPRVPAPDSLTIHLNGPAGRRSVDAFCRDVSELGVGAFVRQQLPAPAIVELDLNLPDRTYTTRARVVFCRSTPGGYQVGLKFIFATDPAAAAPTPCRARPKLSAAAISKHIAVMV